MVKRKIDRKIVKSESGFSFPELLVSTILTLVLLGVTYGFFRVQAHTVKSQESRMEAQEYARAALDLMIREIRNSGSFPTGAACTNPANTEGIVTASAQSFQFVYDVDGDGNCNSANENITYSYDAGGQNITRKEGTTNDPQPLTVGNATDLQFAYFEQGSNVAMNPVVPADIQRVQISLTVQSTNPDTEFGGGQLIATMTSSVDLRNRGIDSGGSTSGDSTSDSSSDSTSDSSSDSGWSGSGSSSGGDSGWSGSGSSGGW